MGGFTQVGSHGSGASIPPVDEQVVSMKLVTPAKGCLHLSQVGALTARKTTCVIGHASKEAHAEAKLPIGSSRDRQASGIRLHDRELIAA